MRNLQLQRASAGSGKTFTLARKFIRNLITAPVDGDPSNGKRRLCHNASELSTRLNSMLAVTFTNKATAEMKQRIVEKLALLSMAADVPEETSIDYLKDFEQELGVSRKDIAATCGIALAVVLNRFSDFNVSTIDTFFQSVLRTFAYETNLPDSYEVELDSDMLAVEGIDSALQEINSVDGTVAAPPDIRFWVDSLMNFRRSRDSSSWNIFNKSGKRGLYSDTVKNARMLESEDYKLKKPALDRYFERLRQHGISFTEAFSILERENELEVRRLFGEARGFAREALARVEALPEDQRAKVSKSAIRDLKKIATMSDIFTKAFSTEAYMKNLTMGENGVFPAKTARKWLDSNADTLNVVAADAAVTYSQLDGLRDGAPFRHWRVYKPSLLFLGMLLEVRNALKEYMAENNIVELSESGMMIHRIIEGSDVPFIYERLGTRIAHYLIDEFQDTSLIQWENMAPLLEAGLSTGEESLVIGDPKQSIYRFRNADSSIITDKLPAHFSERCSICGDSVEENTNWRSERRVVEFNNYFFYLLSRMADDMEGNRSDLSASYGGVVQRPSRKERAGLVDIQYISSGGTGGEDAVPDWYRCVGPMIAGMIERGYSQRDIAVLVDTNRQGRDVIASLIEYNNLPDTKVKIEFVSEESLLVSQSKGVQTVIAALRALSSPSVMEALSPAVRRGEGMEERNRRGNGLVWDDIKVCFSLYMARHEAEEAEIPVLLERFRDDPEALRNLTDLVDNLEAMSLTAIVEYMIHTFVSERQRADEAPFLAALQDMVIDYMGRYPADISSFLGWWDKKGCRKAVASPEGVDAVNVMTIHKSKGLQFKCVIIPDAGIRFAAKGSEWRWVEPVGIRGDRGLVPDFVPVSTDDMKDTMAGSGDRRTILWKGVHTDEYRRFVDSVTLDQLNKAYVGFTRAEEELHLFVPLAAKVAAEASGQFSAAVCDGETHPHENPSDALPLRDEPGFGSVGEALLGLSLGHDRYLRKILGDKRIYMFPDETGKSPGESEWSVEAFQPVESRSVEDAGTEDGAGDQMPVVPPIPVGRIMFGRPFTAVENLERRREREEKERSSLKVTTAPETVRIERYRSLDFPRRLHFRDPRSPLVSGDGEIRELDPRSEGILLHNLLEHIRVKEDLDSALARMRIEGKITRMETEGLRRKTLAALAQPGVGEWFRPGLKVLTERTILRKGSEDRRPDRIVVDAEGNATVIDFKFGQREKPSYRTQIKRYMDLLRETGHYRSVTGYIWYVELSRKVAVE